MSLTEKYQKLIDFAEAKGVQNLSVVEQNSVLYVTGEATAMVKDQLWKIYDEIDPDMRAADMVLKIEVVEGGEEIYEIKKGDNLSKIAKKYPGMTWQKIYEANKDQIKDPNLIHPGQKIIIPL
ncbi:LysM repeat protein [Parabacteroides sp. PF5-5]|uniref:LysM peptidoglycan-binding domain-containing protein n=1 Tax=unclassified Parabacteroides TaxID=2649774 RepID=UPI002475449A|nr:MULTISPECIES: LysM peptidoglycan-binding domain-containing protein [unclassified Parabacteroides]MDH6305019.1 LysM repeat protein [Parabacteroides sp. PH5-39]MDH6315896.1 LysM repeat protein [Parabacteroides sp. PF5-13]MDH6319553.1 LysM repeat protein [Parabacteroides sp. PH5-13]MDH6323284.1 LysM repeat protein [Parabacteroides sp. PH5-8]MDH6327208.1 LysM repeat protein [Parabacteroides sp. PH5-41]